MKPQLTLLEVTSFPFLRELIVEDMWDMLVSFRVLEPFFWTCTHIHNVSELWHTLTVGSVYYSQESTPAKESWVRDASTNEKPGLTEKHNVFKTLWKPHYMTNIKPQTIQLRWDDSDTHTRRGTISESEHYLSMNDAVSSHSLILRCMCQCYDIYSNCVAQTYC